MDLATISPAAIWLICGIIMFFLELFIPGLVIAFFGGGALITSLTTWIGITSTFTSQMLVFLISSILLLLLLRKLLSKVFMGAESSLEGEYNFSVEIGKIVPVIELIEPNEVGGKVKYQGAPWSAKAETRIGPGESVKITGFDNLTLIVERVKDAKQ